MSGNKSRWFSKPLHRLDPDARIAFRGIRLRRLVIGLPRGAGAEDELTFAAERSADAVARDRALVLRIRGARLLVDVDLAPVVEGDHVDVALEHLEPGHEVTQLAGDQVAAVAVGFADRIRAHTVRAAERHLLGRGQVFG